MGKRTCPACRFKRRQLAALLALTATAAGSLGLLLGRRLGAAR